MHENVVHFATFRETAVRPRCVEYKIVQDTRIFFECSYVNKGEVKFKMNVQYKSQVRYNILFIFASSDCTPLHLNMLTGPSR